ncbi:MAG: nickel-dependent hydrogenase large subunit [Magnetovibrionaceae bacterium]
MTRIVVGPFNRVEGDLDVSLDIEDGVVRDARVTAPLYRGFETMMNDRPVLDVLTIVPRICGICSISQSMAASAALRGLYGLEQAPNGILASNILHAVENLADHLTHFYLFFMPDFTREAYAERPWHEAVARRFSTDDGEGREAFIRARARLMHVIGILAGKWPHTLAIQPGGTTKAINLGERARLQALLAEFRAFFEQTVLGGRIEDFVALSSQEALADWALLQPADRGDFRLFLFLAVTLGLDQMGPLPLRLMSFGAYEGGRQDRHLFSPGVLDGEAGPGTIDTAAITEDLSHAWLEGETAHPFDGMTVPERDGLTQEAYSWCKAPRLGGETCEVGAVARQAVDGHALIRSLLERNVTTVHSRVVARILESARLILALEEWARNLIPGAPFSGPLGKPASSKAFGLVEAARGSLGHWVTLKNDRVLSYQIIAPTTWNFSPRDASGKLGPVEKALIGTPVGSSEATPVAVQHIVRSFDPCMVCTVH